MKNKGKKVYGVYFAYRKQDILPEEEYNKYPTDYPREVARIHVYGNVQQQLDAYANTMCPASRCVTANSEKEFNEKIEQLKNNFENPKWIEKCIEPYL